MTRPTFIHPLLLVVLIAFVSEFCPARESAVSLYDLESKWRDGHSRTVNFADLRGKVRVLAMGYTSCQYACPRIIADMRAVEAALPSGIGSSVVFTFISFDPKGDTPERLRQFQKKNKLDAWTFLTGENDGVAELAVALDVKFQKSGETDFAHSNAIFVVDNDGRVLHRQDTLGSPPEGAVKAILKALP